MHWFLRSTFIVSTMISVSCFDISSKPVNITSSNKISTNTVKQVDSNAEIYELFKPVCLKPIEEKKLSVKPKPIKKVVKKQKIKKQKPEKIKPIYKPFDVTLSPKKVKKHLYITKSTPIDLNYEITDQTGNTLFEGEIKPNKNKLNMEDVSNGVYYFHVVFPDTNIKKAYRFIVNRSVSL